uniref:Uncharacterized protein n=1 Tax=Solanum lycopersicum TaxID=4081 RepID=A0A3Q7G587_SOLLC
MFTFGGITGQVGIFLALMMNTLATSLVILRIYKFILIRIIGLFGLLSLQVIKIKIVLRKKPDSGSHKLNTDAYNKGNPGGAGGGGIIRNSDMEVSSLHIHKITECVAIM